MRQHAIRFAHRPRASGWPATLALAVLLTAPGCIPVVGAVPPARMYGGVGPRAIAPGGPSEADAQADRGVLGNEWGLGIHPLTIAGDVDVWAGWTWNLGSRLDDRRFHGPFVEASLLKRPLVEGSTLGWVLSGQARLVTADGFSSTLGFGGQLRLSLEPTVSPSVTRYAECNPDRFSREGYLCGVRYSAGALSYGPFLAVGVTHVGDFTVWQVTTGAVFQLPAGFASGLYLFMP